MSAARCEWCEPLGGNVTLGARVEEWAETILSGRLHDRIATANGGSELSVRLAALRAAYRELGTAGGEGSRMVAQCAGLSLDSPEWATRAAFDLVMMLPAPVLESAVREAFDLFGMSPLDCGACGNLGCYECDFGGRS